MQKIQITIDMLVIATICIDKHKLLSGFTGKLHFVSSVVKRRYFVKISHIACSSLSNFLKGSDFF